MVDVDMSLMPPKIIERKACLWARGPSWLSKDPRLKKMSKHLKEGRIKGNKRIYMKVGKGGVQHNIYNRQIVCSNEFKFQRLPRHGI